MSEAEFEPLPVKEVEIVPLGQVETIKKTLVEKQTDAEEMTPEDMELVGWMLDGWVANYTLIDAKARPVYAFILPIVEEEEEAVE